MRRVNDRDNVEVSYDTLENLPEGISKGLVDYEVDYEVVKPISKHAERKATPVFSGVLKYFPKAIKYVSKASYVGQQQHNPDKPLAWDRSKSGDELDALTRHLIDHSVDPMDDDGVLHLGKVAWRALAALQKHLENEGDDNPQ